VSKYAVMAFLVKESMELNIVGNDWYGRSFTFILTQAHRRQGYRGA